MGRVTWSKRARRDVDGIEAYIAADAPDTAADFVARLKASTARLGDFPNSGRHVAGEDASVREVFFGPYRVIYQVRFGGVGILRVRHGRMRL